LRAGIAGSAMYRQLRRIDPGDQHLAARRARRIVLGIHQDDAGIVEL
jgi:hypothetical protein